MFTYEYPLGFSWFMFYLLTLLHKIRTNHTKTRWQQAEEIK
ncbi:hypothetical protein PHEL85_0474 [Polaribacter sp. Hel1_85]|nr:hypothetical protein PHEL85_0474 [Polaribacter sp. Hel1_85]